MRITLTRLATFLGLLTAIFASLVAATPATADSSSFVRFATPLGAVDVELLPQVAPKTVANFVSYVDSGAYGSTFIERSAKQQLADGSMRDFVLQGGGYDVSLANASNPITPVPARSPVQGEPQVSNTRGTLAMALPSDSNGATNPNGGTDEWFFNLANNTPLDGQGFTVFGKVANARSMAVLDAIAQLPTTTFSQVANGAFPTPVLNGTAADPAQLVTTHIARYTDTTPPTITVASPVQGAHLREGQAVTPQYTCDDGDGVGVASCTVTAALDTTMVGLDSFTVTATDLAGNTATKTVEVTVSAANPPTVPPHHASRFSTGTVTVGRVNAAGALPITVRCPAGQGACAGTFTLTAMSGRHRVTLGAVRYRVGAGHRATVTLRLSRAAQTMMRHGHGRLSARTTLAATGGRARSGTVVLLPAPRRR